MPWKTEAEKPQRWRFIREWMTREKPLAELCRRLGISRKTGHKWVRRFKAEGRAGLGNRTRVAGTVHNRPSRLWLERLRRWRILNPRKGAAKLRWALVRRFGAKGAPSEAAISRWLKCWELSRPTRRPGRKEPALIRSPLTVARRPNDVWTMDFKGREQTGDGTGVEAFTVRDLASRLILTVDLGTRPNVQETREALGRVFRRYGLPRVIRSDNGTPFGATGARGFTRLSAWLVKLGIRVEFIAPGRPDQNGAHEQMHRVYKEEAWQPPTWTLGGQKKRTERWRRSYNEERPHEGIGMRVPAEVYRRSPRKMPTRLGPWRYPKGWQSRLVKGKGMIRLGGRGRFIGEAFEGERVGLKWGRPGAWMVYYGPLLIGELLAGETGGIYALHYQKRTRRRSVDEAGAAPRSARLRPSLIHRSRSKV